MKKRILSFLLVFAMISSFCMPITAYAAQTTNGTKKTELTKEEMLLLKARPNSGSSMPTNYYSNSGYIRNEYIEAYIGYDGHYTMGTVEGDPNSDTDDNRMLLYGHPYASTSETLVRIDDVDYWFTSYVTNVSFSEDGKSCTATALINGIRVKQILTLTKNPYTNMEDLVSIEYICENTTTESKQVGIRIMLDTMLGDNDGSPFRVNGMDVVKEIEFSGNDVPQYWQSFDSLNDPRVTSSGFFFFADAQKPDKVQFTAWPNIVSSPWDYEVYEQHYLTNDSAVSAYFNPRVVAAGGTRSVVTYYGISGFAEGNSNLSGNLAVRVTAPSVLEGTDLTDGYLNNPFNVTAYVDNIGPYAIEDLRAVLSLENAPQLSLDPSQSHTISLGDLYSGDNTTAGWTLYAAPQSETVTVDYSISFYAAYTISDDTVYVVDDDTILIKTIDLTVDLVELVDGYRTVTFDLNGADGEAPEQQRVPIYGYAAAPAAPTREGYVFEGWYANSDCIGTPWFSVFNNYQGDRITQNITLYAKWSLRDEFTYGQDTFSFINSARYFEGGQTTNNYRLSGDYYDILLSDLPNSVQTQLRQAMDEKWGGSCFGMSSVLTLVYAGALDVDYFQQDAQTLYDLTAPKDSFVTWQLITYYQLMQSTPVFSGARGQYDRENETPNNQAVIEALKASSYPVVLGFDIMKNNGRREGGHAVVAYAYTETATTYEISIWDPNDRDDFNTLTISKDFTESSFADTYDTNSRYSYIKYALTMESEVYGYKNLQGQLSLARDALLSGDDLTLQTSYDSFTITGSDGTFAVIENGIKVSGDMEISGSSVNDSILVDEYGELVVVEQNDWMFAIVDDGNVSYTIIPEESDTAARTVAQYDTSMIRNGENGFYAGLSANGNGEIEFSESGQINTRFEEDTTQTITVSSNDMTTSWNAVTVTSTAKDLTVAAGSDGAEISSETEAVVSVAVVNNYSSAAFEDVSLNGDSVTLETGSEDSNTATLGDQTVALGYTAVFYSQGGSAVEAQADIPAGSLVTRPAAPTREGFIFDGWYTTSDCLAGTEWNFASRSINEDIRLYAKWLVDQNYTHTITFRAPGHDDCVLVVRHGTALTEDQIPTVPRLEGYVGAWDISDFSNITSDQIVNAIYTPLALVETCTVIFDGNGGFGDMASVLVAMNDTYDLPECSFTAPDFMRLRGWSVNGVEYQAGDEIRVSSDLTIYAIWEYIGVMGDTNLNGGLDPRDVIDVLKAVAGRTTDAFTEEQKIAADVNYDERVNSRDAVNILVMVSVD